jgi:hypothetical protein
MRIQQAPEHKVIDQSQYAKDILMEYEHDIKKVGVDKRRPRTPLPRGQTFTKTRARRAIAGR